MIATPPFTRTKVAGYSQVASEYDSNANREGMNLMLLSAKEVALSLRGSAHHFLTVEPYPTTSVIVASTADWVGSRASR